MTEQRNDLSERRILELERRVSRLQSLFAFAVVAGAALFATGWSRQSKAQPASVVTAERFVLVDRDGHERAILGFKDTRVGLSILSEVGGGITELVFVGADRLVENSEQNRRLHAWITVRNELTPKVWGRVSANDIGLHDEGEDQHVALRYVNAPSLEFTDKSGFSYISLGYDTKNGTRFDVKAPLGIKGAFHEVGKASIQEKPVDERINEAWNKSMRFQLVVPPFSEPYLSLHNDGKQIWGAR